MFAELKPGLTTGNLRLVRRIGAGAMGSVWLADHLTLGTPVAVKFIGDASMIGDELQLARFTREAAVVAKLKSPYVVQVLDRSATQLGVPYMVMELVEGETLSRHLNRRGAASVEVTRRVVDHVGRALAKAHAAGIVHRDIKPENIFVALTDEGVVCKLFDFGIAKQQFRAKGEMLTGSGSMVGTPAYMSPEQFADSSAVNESADLWGFAVVAYHCLTGSRPFVGTDLVELCANILKGQHTPPSELREELPPAVDAWFARAFQPKRDQRFATATEMTDAFLAALGDLGTDEPSLSEVMNALDAVPRKERAADQHEGAGGGTKAVLHDSRSGLAVAANSTTVVGNRGPGTSQRRSAQLAVGGALLVLGIATGVLLLRPSGAAPPTTTTDSPANGSVGSTSIGSPTETAAQTAAPTATSVELGHEFGAPSAFAPTAGGTASEPAAAASSAATSAPVKPGANRVGPLPPQKKPVGTRKLDYDHGF